MNWTKLAINIGAAVVTALVSSGTLSGEPAIIAAAVAANLIALFQKPPHQEGK